VGKTDNERNIKLGFWRDPRRASRQESAEAKIKKWHFRHCVFEMFVNHSIKGVTFFYGR
jgi:hypothetical protein